ncbi:hypothetical protein [Streptosporangium vulgare]|uniref:hypothetical protein n=1 Tax=Streptosporangium vulgare TaxID=46190 RepID=UPI0031D9F279
MLTGVVDDLRELSRGIHPAILSKGGLVPALKALAAAPPFPSNSNWPPSRACRSASRWASTTRRREALTNVAKHANASVVYVTLGMAVRPSGSRSADDGGGGADYGKGSGLIGLRDRVETLGGRLRVESSVEEGPSLSW